MCVLAVTGQLGGSQMYELNDHISHCDSCRRTLESVAQVSVQAMPLLASEQAPRESAMPEGMRERFLTRLKQPEARLPVGSFPWSHDDAPPKPLLVRNEHAWVKKSGTRDSDSAKSEQRRFSRSWRLATGLAACGAIASAAYYVGQWRAMQSQQKASQVSSAIAHPSPENRAPLDEDRVSQLEGQRSKLEGQLSEFKQRFANAKADQESLREELTAARVKLAALAWVQSESQQSQAEAQEARSQLAVLQAQVNRLNQGLAESDIKLGIQKQTAEELSTKLEATEMDLQQERDLKSAKAQLGDLVAARNLHIVDVYDAEPNGKRQRSFGRVFYIEGKSLVFYAYDLEDPGRLNAKVVFHVWGGKAGVKEVSHSLGILRKDDAGQGRWAMTFDDPNVLGQINSVFVTAESANKHSDEPRGKKVLYAYFGNHPNHP
jgi:hypothetical protein